MTSVESKKLTYEYVGVTEPEKDIIEFEILPEHLKLLRNQYVFWDGTTGLVDPVRPYGSKDILRSMLNVLELCEPYDHDALYRLHAQAALALQICLKTGKFKAGIFRAPKYSMLWKQFMPKKKTVKEQGDEDAE